MCNDKIEVKTKKNDNEKDGLFYLRDYLGRSLSNCQRVEVDEKVI